MKNTIIFLLLALLINIAYGQDTTLYPNGKIRRIIYKDSSIYKFYHNDTSSHLRVAFKTFKKNGQKMQHTLSYYTNGNLFMDEFYIEKRFVFFKRYINDSIWKHYRFNGSLEWYAVYKNKQLYLYKDYYESGNKKSVIQFSKDRTQRFDTLFYPNGQLERISFYKKGRLYSVNFYDNEGLELPNPYFKNGTGKLLVYKKGINTANCIYKKGKSKRCYCCF